MVRIVLGVMLAVLVNTVAANAQTLMYGSSFLGPNSPATLFVFRPDQGVIGSLGRPVGPIGFRQVGSLDFSPGGVLYGVGSDGTNTVLITINTATGAGTVVGPLGLGNRAFQDIAFRPSDGTLFGFSGAIGPDSGEIYTIDTTTGAATLVGEIGLGYFPDGNGLAFRGATLYYATETALYTIDQTTGLATFVTLIAYQPAFGIFTRPPAMKFDPVAPTLWAIVNGAGDNQSLGIIDPATGQTTFINHVEGRIDGLAVTIGPLATPVPTLSEWAQIAMVTVLVLVGLATLRRRRSALS